MRKIIVCLYCGEKFRTFKKVDKHKEKCKGLLKIRMNYNKRRAQEILKMYGYYQKEEF